MPSLVELRWAKKRKRSEAGKKAYMTRLEKKRKIMEQMNPTENIATETVDQYIQPDAPQMIDDCVQTEQDKGWFYILCKKLSFEF